MIIFKKSNTLVFIFFIFLFLMTFTFQFYVNKQKMYEQLSNSLYTRNAEMIVVNDASWTLEDMPHESEYRIFQEVNDTYKYLLNNSGDWSPPLISGSFFNPSEKTKTAVIGQEMINDLVTVDSVKYLVYNNENYEVKGVMGARFASSIDYLVLLVDPELQMNNPRIVIDSDSSIAVEKIMNYLSNSSYSFTLIDNFQKGLLRLGNTPTLYKFLLVELYLLLLIGLISITRYWYEKEQEIIKTMYMLGLSKKYIYFELFIKNLIILIISASTSIIFFYGASKFEFFTITEVISLVLASNLISWIALLCFISRDHKKA